MGFQFYFLSMLGFSLLSVQVMKEEHTSGGPLLQYLLHDMLARFDAGVDPVTLDFAVTGGEVIQDLLICRHFRK